MHLEGLHVVSEVGLESPDLLVGDLYRGNLRTGANPDPHQEGEILQLDSRPLLDERLLREEGGELPSLFVVPVVYLGERAIFKSSENSPHSMRLMLPLLTTALQEIR